MRRAIGHAVTVLSAALAVLAGAAWVASCVVSVQLSDSVIDSSAEPVEWAVERSIILAPHRLVYAVTTTRYDHARSLVTLAAYLPSGFTWHASTRDTDAVLDRRALLPAVSRPTPVDTGFGRRSHVAIRVPFWLVLLAAVVPPMLAAQRLWRRRRRPATACTRCGYDLRESTGRCPECGAATLRRSASPGGVG